MSSKEAEREEMKEETHDIEDMEQDELVEKDSEDEGSWINECLINRESIKKQCKKRRSWMITQSWAFDTRAFCTSREYIFNYSWLYKESLQTH